MTHFISGTVSMDAPRNIWRQMRGRRMTHVNDRLIRQSFSGQRKPDPLQSLNLLANANSQATRPADSNSYTRPPYFAGKSCATKQLPYRTKMGVEYARATRHTWHGYGHRRDVRRNLILVRNRII